MLMHLELAGGPPGSSAYFGVVCQMSGGQLVEAGFGRGDQDNLVLLQVFSFRHPASLGMLLPDPLSSNAPALWVLYGARQWD